MSTDNLNQVLRRVAIGMGADPERALALLARNGKKGMAGVEIFSNPPGSQPYPGKRQSSPYPDAPSWAPSNPGKIDDERIRTVREPENSDDEEVDDPAGVRGPVRRTAYDPIGVTYPSGDTNVTLRNARNGK